MSACHTPHVTFVASLPWNVIVGQALWALSSPRCRQVDRRFRVLWADHGDEVSRQYAGTVRLHAVEAHF